MSQELSKSENPFASLSIDILVELEPMLRREGLTALGFAKNCPIINKPYFTNRAQNMLNWADCIQSLMNSRGPIIEVDAKEESVFWRGLTKQVEICTSIATEEEPK
jgi:hypothetical protein